ncbi:MAG: peptidoglycan DD-metalloendopeptidase family protein [Alphaproteobacteria bacterium]|nr:peptidoglycan DD-metalloendopeptidase family protein [Alphaproteobacteria bacterium]
MAAMQAGRFQRLARIGVRVRAAGSVLLVLGVAAACTGSAPPPAPVTLADGSSAVTVGRSDTLYDISRRHRVAIRDLVVMNGLPPPYTVRPGQSLRLPAPGAMPGAIPGAMAAVGAGAAAMVGGGTIEATPLAPPPHTARPAPTPGQSAAQGPAAGAVGAALPVPPAATPPAATPPGPGPGSGPVALLPVPPPRASEPATEARPEPSAAGIAAALDRAPLEPSPPPRQAAGPVPLPLPPVASATVASGPVASGPAASAPPDPAQPPSPRAASPSGPAMSEPPAPRAVSASGFQWPLRGDLLNGFGRGGGGLVNDGINIAAPRGATVYAAQAGFVAYAGNEIRGYGNLVLLRHSSGWVTAYGHNDAILVRQGETVRRGQPIARVGASGSVGAPQLHFQMRRLGRPVDPLRYLPTQLAGR